jgi:hypothetical protein
MGYRVMHDGNVSITGVDALKVGIVGTAAAVISINAIVYGLYYYNITRGIWYPLQIGPY